MSVDHLKQLMGAEECVGRVEAYVERNNDRKSLSGCVILVDRFPTKAFTRQQSSVAMSSAEAELIAITEGAKEAVGVVALVQHIYGPVLDQQRSTCRLLRLTSRHQHNIHAWLASSC